MAFSHGSKTRVYVNGFDLTGVLRSVNVNRAGEAVDITTFNATDKNYLAGLRDGTLGSEGFFDPSTGLSDDVLGQILSVDPSLWAVPIQGDSLGGVAYCAPLIETRYNIPLSVSDAAKVTTEGQAKPLERGIILHPKGTEAATGNGTSHDGGASSAFGGSGYIQAFEPGSFSITGIIQHSSDDSIFTDLITFTLIAATGRVALRVSVTGTVNRYTRARFVVGGAGATPPFFMAFHRNRN